jgi:Ca-activated chloride channel family protein
MISSAQSQPAENDISTGNVFYRQKQFDKAATEYKKAIETDPGNNKAKYNLANTLYKQNKLDEAVKLFTEVSGNNEKIDLKEQAFYNKGTVLSKQKKLEESIEAYKAALRLNPEDNEARENLQKALLELKKKNPPKPKPDDSKKKKPEQRSSMSLKEAEQRLRLLSQKEKAAQERMQKEKSKAGGSQTKDW